MSERSSSRTRTRTNPPTRRTSPRLKKNVMTIHTQPTSTQGLGVLKTIQKSPVHTLTVKNLAINLEGITKNTSLYTVARRWIYNGKVEEAEEDMLLFQLAPIEGNKTSNSVPSISVSSEPIPQDKQKQERVEKAMNGGLERDSAELRKELIEKAVDVRKNKIRDYEKRLLPYHQRIKSLLGTNANSALHSIEESVVMGLHSMRRSESIKKHRK